MKRERGRYEERDCSAAPYLPQYIRTRPRSLSCSTFYCFTCCCTRFTYCFTRFTYCFTRLSEKDTPA